MNQKSHLLFGSTLLILGIALLMLTNMIRSRSVLLLFVLIGSVSLGVYLLLRAFRHDKARNWETQQPREEKPEPMEEPPVADSWDSGLNDFDAGDSPDAANSQQARSASAGKAAQQAPNAYQRMHQDSGYAAREKTTIFTSDYQVYEPGITRYNVIFATAAIVIPEDAPGRIEINSLFSNVTVVMPSNRALTTIADVSFGAAHLPSGSATGFGTKKWLSGKGRDLLVQVAVAFSAIRVRLG